MYFLVRTDTNQSNLPSEILKKKGKIRVNPLIHYFWDLYQRLQGSLSRHCRQMDPDVGLIVVNDEALMCDE